MNISEFMLIACCVIGLLALIIVAIDEPRYTWHSIATFDELLADMQAGFDNLAANVGEKIAPVLLRVIGSFNDLSSEYSSQLIGAGASYVEREIDFEIDSRADEDVILCGIGRNIPRGILNGPTAKDMIK